MIGEKLKALRQRTGMSVRAVASELGFETHSKYSYYESPRFKSNLPLDLAKRLSKMWEYLGVQPHEVLQLAGLSHIQAIEENAVSTALKYQPTLNLPVLFPDEIALREMFGHMIMVSEHPELPASLAEELSVLLPIALGAVKFSKDSGTTNFTFDESYYKALKDAWRRYRARFDEWGD